MNRDRISKSLKISLPLLRVLSRLTPRVRKIVIKEICGELVIYNSLHELAHNTLSGNLKLDKQQLRKLKPYKPLLKKLCSLSNRKCAKKRKLLVQKGEGILPILIPALTALFSNLIS